MKTLRSILFVIGAMAWVLRVEAATVALLRPSSDAPAIHEASFRLQGELVAVGLSIAIVDRPPVHDMDSEAAHEWFEQMSAARGIDAFIDVVGVDTPVAAEVWIRERSPDRLRHSRVQLEHGSENAAATLAIRAIEVLRSSFLAFDFADERRPRAPPVTPTRAAKTERTSERAARFRFEAGATALTSFDRVGPALLPLARVEWAFSPWLALQATGAGFGTRPRVESAAGKVEVAQQFVLLGLCACGPMRAGIHPVASLSLGTIHTELAGEASAPLLAHRVERWSFLVDGSAGARLGLPERFHLTLAGHLQVAAPYVAIHFVDKVVATTGRPNLLFALAAGAHL